MEVHEGDVIEIPSNKVDRAVRRGRVTEVIQQDPLKVEVVWDDGHRTLISPRAPLKVERTTT